MPARPSKLPVLRLVAKALVVDGWAAQRSLVIRDLPACVHVVHLYSPREKRTNTDTITRLCLTAAIACKRSLEYHYRRPFDRISLDWIGDPNGYAEDPFRWGWKLDLPIGRGLDDPLSPELSLLDPIRWSERCVSAVRGPAIDWFQSHNTTQDLLLTSIASRPLEGRNLYELRGLAAQAGAIGDIELLDRISDAARQTPAPPDSPTGRSHAAAAHEIARIRDRVLQGQRIYEPLPGSA